MSIDSGFGRRLRHERERRKISLATIAATTKIGCPLLEGLERDDFSRWPAGIFRRSFMRAYAEAIGLDADAIVREFVERHPDPEEAAAAAGAAPFAPSTGHLGPMLRLRIADEPGAFRGGPILTDRGRRCAAAAWDAGVVAAIALLLFVVVNSFWKPFGVLAMTYYGGGILVLGNTPGVCLFAAGPGAGGSRRARPLHGVNAAALLRRIRAAIEPRLRS